MNKEVSAKDDSDDSIGCHDKASWQEPNHELQGDNDRCQSCADDDNRTPKLVLHSRLAVTLIFNLILILN